MSWSLGEAKALGVKAAKGAGFNWGVAEEVGVVIAWLHASGAPGVAALAQHLEWLNANPAQLTEVSEYFQPTPNPHTVYCPIALGCALQDHGLNSLTRLSQVQIRQPLLLVPFLANASDQAITVSWGQCKMGVNPRAMLCKDQSDKLLTHQAQCNISIGPVKNDIRLLTRVPSSDKQYIQKLEQYAAKTYAPATEASRLAGAGAGLTDND